ncbi:MAG: hypothetical protein Q9162_007154 [Coniocarpon cinnabarinum]
MTTERRIGMMWMFVYRVAKQDEWKQRHVAFAFDMGDDVHIIFNAPSKPGTINMWRSSKPEKACLRNETTGKKSKSFQLAKKLQVGIPARLVEDLNDNAALNLQELAQIEETPHYQPATGQNSHHRAVRFVKCLVRAECLGENTATEAIHKLSVAIAFASVDGPLRDRDDNSPYLSSMQGRDLYAALVKLLSRRDVNEQS